MKNIKDITISIFAVIGFVAIITGFTNNQAQQTTPESHVWHMPEGDIKGFTYMYNKATGEVRSINGLGANYKIMTEKVKKK